MAIIDIGSNSVKLYLEGGGIKIPKLTRLSEGLNENEKLSPAAMERTVNAVVGFCRQAADAGENVRIFATEAARAEGGREFAALILEKTGITLDILTGEQEALCGFLGAAEVFGTTVFRKNSKNSGQNQILVIDVGGASAEVSKGLIHAGRAPEITCKKSIATGAVRLYELFGRRALKKEELAQKLSVLFNFIDHKINCLKKDAENIESTVLIGGTATSLAAVKHQLKQYDSAKTHKTMLSQTEIKMYLDGIFMMSMEKRMESYPFLGLMRAEVLPYGIALLYRILVCLGVDSAIVSEKGTIEGYIKLYA